MGFFDSFKVGLGAIGDFVGGIVGAGLAAAPTILPILQATGVIPQIQPSPYVTSTGPGAGPLGYTALPGGYMIPYPSAPKVNPALANLPLAAPVGFSAGLPTALPAAPGGIMPAFPSTTGGFTTAGLSLPGVGGGVGLPFIDIVPQGGGAQLARLTSPYVPTAAGARAQPFVSANPITGKLTWFKPAGRPILWSGDLTACKRVSRIASRARRVSRKR